jgi:hypothetical protein
LGALALPARAEQEGDRRCKVLVTAVVGGGGTAHFPPSAAAPLLHRLGSAHVPGVCVRTFSAYCPWCAHRWIKREFSGRSKARPTEEQLENGPGVILYGYSLGGPTVLYVARMLESDGIPVALAVAVDSKGFTRGIFPKNVKVAANFYELQLFRPMSGKRNMSSEDPQATDFLGNIRVAHVEHFEIAGSAPVQGLLLSTIRELASQQNLASSHVDQTGTSSLGGGGAAGVDGQ